jgi:hypothetical protein
MARIFKRKEGLVPYSPSAQARLELSRTSHVQYLVVKLTVNHTNGTTPVLNDAKLWSLINSVEIVANGNENIKQIPATKLFIDNIMATGMDGLNSVDLTPSADGESYAYAKVYFEVPNAVRPHDTIINTRLFSTFDMLVNWGSSASLGSDVTVTDAKLEVSSASLIGYERDTNETIKYFKETSLMKEVTSSSNEMTIQLPVEKLYKGLTIMATNDNIKTNDVINNVIIKSGETVFFNWDFETLQALNNMNFTPETSANLNGIGIVEFTERGRLSDMLNTVSAKGGFNTLEVVLDVTKSAEGTDRIYIFSDTVQNTGVVEKTAK